LTAAGRRLEDEDQGQATAARRFAAVRSQTLALAAPLSAEDQQVQSMPDVSPTKWHLAHMTWFFEAFLLGQDPAYHPFDPLYGFLFNSYYETVGARWPRPERGLLSRPSLKDVLAYRRHVDGAMQALIAAADAAAMARIAPLLDLGLHHEQQHQELILMDIKHVFSRSPLAPAYAPARRDVEPAATAPLEWIAFGGGLVEIGHDGQGFAFDNEGPRHKVWLEPFALASRLSTCGDYLAFVEDGGYARSEFWLSEGWATAQREGWRAPLYWQDDADGAWAVFTLAGLKRLDPAEPVCHLSFYEADAFARWSGRRLPTEAEWETAAQTLLQEGALPAGHLADAGVFHPRPAAPILGLQQMIGEVWEWTSSPYGPYPRYRPPPGPIGEYNGKFMSNQMVLRGGAAVTPAGHVRITYRNFFPPTARWAFSGVRLADEA
jgi:ergothioneine biosynthesis protein EgtB